MHYSVGDNHVTTKITRNLSKLEVIKIMSMYLFVLQLLWITGYVDDGVDS